MNKLFLLFVAVLVLSCSSPEEVKFERYRVAGERLYLQHCANCHQMDGSGFQKLYPPLSGHDWLNENYEWTMCLMKYGMDDTLNISGIEYTLPMVGIELTNLEIAEISTFMYNSWGNNKGLIDVVEVNKIMENCEDSN